MERSDLAFEALPAAEKLWKLDTALPFSEAALARLSEKASAKQKAVAE